MRRIGLNGAAVAAVVLTVGLAAVACTTPSPGAAESLSGTDAPAARLEALVALDRRVAAVGYRLVAANVDLCAAQRDVAGWTLHAANQYSDDLRPLAVARFGLDGDLPGILAVAMDSPASKAGLNPGDLLIAVNDQPLERGETDGPAAHDGLGANIARLDLALARGPLTVRVRRGGLDRTVRVSPARVCTSIFQVDPSNEYNARADGKGVFISTTMAAYAVSDDELALILGHELAHNVLGHRPAPPPLAGPLPVPDTALPPGDRGTAERDADRVGLFLAARAGYATTGAADFWRRFGADHWQVRYPQIGHPSAEARARALERAHAEIAAQRDADQPLRP